MHHVLNIAGVSCALFAGLAHAQPASTSSGPAYPNRLVRIIVPFVPGGPTDIQARWAAQQLSAALGQNSIVENRGGVGGVPGTEAAVRAAPDDYANFIRSEIRKWARVAKAAGILKQ